MSLFFKDPIQQIVDELYEKNKGSLKAPLAITDLVLTEVSFNQSTGVREVNATPADSSKYFGAIKNPGVTYKRYSAEKMWLGVKPRVVVAQGATVLAVLTALSTAYNIPEFTVEPEAGDATKPYDFPKEIRTQTVDFADLALKVLTLNFKANSIGWYGVLTINCYDAAKNLSTIIKNPNLNGLIYPDNTEGKVGSLSTLTYPINFKLPTASKTLLGTKGGTLGADKTDPLVAAIINDIMDYYTFDDPTAVRASLEKNVPGSTVLETNLADGVQPPVQVIIQTKTVAGTTFVGNIILNNPAFI